MKDLFIMGGPLFMGVLTLLFVLIVAWTIYYVLAYKKDGSNKLFYLQRIKYVKSIGLFAVVFGIFGQLIGLYSAFSIITEVQNISPSLFFQGMKVSMITTMYGMLIYLISILLWGVSSLVIEKE